MNLNTASKDSSHQSPAFFSRHGSLTLTFIHVFFEASRTSRSHFSGVPGHGTELLTDAEGISLHYLEMLGERLIHEEAGMLLTHPHSVVSYSTVRLPSRKPCRLCPQTKPAACERQKTRDSRITPKSTRRESFHDPAGVNLPTQTHISRSRYTTKHPASHQCDAHNTCRASNLSAPDQHPTPEWSLGRCEGLWLSMPFELTRLRLRRRPQKEGTHPSTRFARLQIWRPCTRMGISERIVYLPWDRQPWLT